MPESTRLPLTLAPPSIRYCVCAQFKTQKGAPHDDANSDADRKEQYKAWMQNPQKAQALRAFAHLSIARKLPAQYISMESVAQYVTDNGIHIPYESGFNADEDAVPHAPTSEHHSSSAGSAAGRIHVDDYADDDAIMDTVDALFASSDTEPTARDQKKTRAKKSPDSAQRHARDSKHARSSSHDDGKKKHARSSSHDDGKKKHARSSSHDDGKKHRKKHKTHTTRPRESQT